MKNLNLIVDRREIISHVQNLWKTDIFQALGREGFVHDLTNEFARVPRFFADMTNENLETAHFSTWWNVIMNREYDNPFVSDLYRLHEMYHAARMPYVPGIGKAAFDEKMQRNELEASVFSEIEIYFNVPELRSKTFPFAIYADRFLSDTAMKALWKVNRTVCVETIRTIRRDVMVSKPDTKMDDAEKWIRRFADQNTVYSIIWSDRYNEVEEEMSKFHILAATDRQLAADNLATWLVAEARRDPVDCIPFRQEAELFSVHYWANKAKYQDAHRQTK